jgi:purine nucleosidase
MNKIPLLIDTDTAGDDTVALLFGLLCPEFDLKAVTICAGNIGFEQMIENALYTIEMAGRSGEVPVFPGCQTPLVKAWETVENIHGEHGMGIAKYPLARQRPESLHGANAIVEMANKYEGELVIAGIAPFTNLAIALALDPELPKKVKHVYLMAGNNQYLGNVTPAAEYNVWVDPEAAHIVYSAGFELTMVGWEICMRHSVIDDDTWATIEGFDTPLSKFFTDVNQITREFCKREQRLNGSTHPDAITVAGIADPSLFTCIEDRYVAIEYTSELTRGMTVVDELGVMNQPANTQIVCEADDKLFQGMLFDILKQTV